MTNERTRRTGERTNKRANKRTNEREHERECLGSASRTYADRGVWDGWTKGRLVQAGASEEGRGGESRRAGCGGWTGRTGKKEGDAVVRWWGGEVTGGYVCMYVCMYVYCGRSNMSPDRYSDIADIGDIY